MNESTENREIFVPSEEAKLIVDEQEVKAISPYEGSDNFNITRQEIADFGNEGYLLQNVLSEAECHYYIAESEKLCFEEMPGVKKSYRNNTRIVIKSQDIANTLFSRIRPFLEDVTIQGDPHNSHIHGIGPLLQGTWAPLGLNPTFRLCRYLPGGHFAPHFDGHFLLNRNVRSLKTFMLYLNSDFSGGTTNFVDEKQTLYMDKEGRYCAEVKNIQCRVNPEPGMAIIFNHHRLHEGSALIDGVKYIMRTDIMYELQSSSEVSPSEEQALSMVQEAERLEAKGENMQAMELYRKAFKLSPALAASYGN